MAPAIVRIILWGFFFAWSLLHNERIQTRTFKAVLLLMCRMGTACTCVPCNHFLNVIRLVLPW